jgi:CHAD domain-containing protein
MHLAPLVRELVLEGPPGAVETLAGDERPAGLTTSRAHRTRGRRVHYDTPEASLARAGLTLAIDEAEGIFMHTLERRPEAPVCGLSLLRARRARVDSPEPDPSRLARFGGPGMRQLAASLASCLEIEWSSTRRKILADGLAIEATFETAEAHRPDATEKLGRITLRSREAPVAALFRAALHLFESSPVLRPAHGDTAHELARMLAPAPAVGAAHPPTIPRVATLERLIGVALAECLRGIARGESAVRGACDCENVHQMRVAVRRLRSALRLLRGDLDEERVDALRTALTPLAGALGAVRDVDIFLEQLPAGAEGAPPLRDHEEAARGGRAVALAELARMLDSAEHARLELELGGYVLGGEWREAANAARLSMRADLAARELVARADRRARRAGRSFDELTPDQRHHLRLRVKGARYAAELLTPLLSAKRAARYVRRAQALQDALGIESDARRARALAQRLEAASAPASAAFAAGYFAGRAASAASERQRAWLRFRRVRRPWN